MSLPKQIIPIILLTLANFYFLSAQKAVNTSFFDKNGDLSTIEEAFYFRETTDSASFYKSYYAIDTTLFFLVKLFLQKILPTKKMCILDIVYGITEMEI